MDLYDELADWFHLVTHPSDYAEEAEVYRRQIAENSVVPVRSVLELGCGGGNNASHLKQHFELTLTDISPRMLDQSRKINPECEHIPGDMRTIRLGRVFDAVYIHDALCYLDTESDLRAAIESAAVHCRPGGVVLLVPDFVTENFREGTETGGHDEGGRSLRYLEWRTDPDPTDHTYRVDFAFMLREDGAVRTVLDGDRYGLFPRQTWMRLLADAGLEPRHHVESPWEPGGYEPVTFTGRRRV